MIRFLAGTVAGPIFAGVSAFLLAVVLILLVQIHGVPILGSWFGIGEGYIAQIDELKDERDRAATHARDVEIANLTLFDKASLEAAEKAAYLRGKNDGTTINIIQETPRYVTPEINAGFRLPCAVWRLHQAAAVGISPQSVVLPAGFTDADACEIDAITLSNTITENYGKYRSLSGDYIALYGLAQRMTDILNGAGERALDDGR